MPVSAVSPYVPEKVFSEDPSEEMQLILSGIELTFRLNMTEHQRALVRAHGFYKIVKLADWAGVIDVTDVTLSRYSKGHSEPPPGLLYFFRGLYRQIEENPQKGISALMDFLRRREGPDPGETIIPGDVVEPSGAFEANFSVVSGESRKMRIPKPNRGSSNGSTSSGSSSNGSSLGEASSEDADSEEEEDAALPA